MSTVISIASSGSATPAVKDRPPRLRRTSSVAQLRESRTQRPATPLVLAHRGFSDQDRPENTVAAVAAALAAGADGVEIDVRLSADQKLLCSHDTGLFRVAGTSLAVAGHSAATLRRVRLPGGHTLALLEEVLSTAARYGRRRVVVEAKSCANSGSGDQLVTGLRQVLDGFAASLDITVSSFDLNLLGAVRANLRGLPVSTALLGSSMDGAANLLRQAVTRGHGEIHPYVLSLLAEPNVVGAARTLGIEVICWTVNRPQQVAQLAELGVDGLITDDAPGVRAALRYRPMTMDPAAC
jgi:glycerophosphoryl diester phosphodiesterase